MRACVRAGESLISSAKLHWTLQSCYKRNTNNSMPTGQPDRRGSSHGPLKTNSEEDPYELHLGCRVQPHRDPNCGRSACPHWSDPTAVDGQYRHGVQLCLCGQQLSAAEVVS